MISPACQDVETRLQLRSRIVQSLDAKEESTQCVYSVHQESLHRGTARTKSGVYLLDLSHAAALPGTRRVLARLGWEGEETDVFEHPVT
jgi:hypothetical protein